MIRNPKLPPPRAEQQDQLSFIRGLTPFYQAAYEAGELHNFYDMVLIMWFDVWPELSQNPLIQQHNRFVRISFRVTLLFH